MTGNRHLYFLSNIVKEKFTYQDSRNQCPFCRHESLSDIIEEEGSILLVKNKFSTLADAFQTVLIETDSCSADISSYDISHMRKIITFGTNNWLAMERNRDFRSVVFFKNHGPLSGGTINHSHMQIVGLKNIDYRLNLKDDIFDGIEIHREENCSLNISTSPNACATEYNIITSQRNDCFMADNIQKIVQYILKQCSSYNLFFYQWNGSIICKIVPRYVASPFLIGFSIPHTSDRLNTIAEEIHKMYYNSSSDIK